MDRAKNLRCFILWRRRLIHYLESEAPRFGWLLQENGKKVQRRGNIYMFEDRMTKKVIVAAINLNETYASLDVSEIGNAVEL